MKISGQFTAQTGVRALLDLSASKLEQVPTLRDVAAKPDGSISALFTPATGFGRLPIGIKIIQQGSDESGALLQVQGRLGPNLFDVELALAFTASGTGTDVNWEAQFMALGPAASVGQRVAGDIATRAINDVLVAAATIGAAH
ncbi:hypothetical protein [Acrocarpospora sp. B8E8]|uniref:hypothetical protein n=1 Tax=Acrocarpospora sp. B8E8 TaxID=3153572 RepID=UPI00325F7B5F